MVQSKSKRGVALPVAIAITAVLIIITSALIVIALNSMSNTSVDVNTRQAYINAKSALNYAASYYNGGAELPGGGGTVSAKEYIVMTDVGGTSTEGATVVQLPTDSKVTSAKTYVEAEFVPKSTPGDTDKLRLTAYALAGDAFKHKARTIRLTGIYDVQNGTANPKKITDIVVKNEGAALAPPPDEYITLNVRTNPEYNFVPYFYTWTFEDKNGSNNCGGKVYYYVDKLTSINETSSVFSNYSAVQNVEKNINFPSGIWNNDPSNEGPQGASVQKAGTTDWYQYNYSIKDKYVNYFHAIIARKGAMLKQATSEFDAHKIQSCEMFHLWYGDPSDKQIYFEILKEDFYYYYNPNWNGTDGLEDYFLVYTARPATVVHVKAIDSRTSPINDNSANPSLSITGLGTVPTLQYEGCGWWVTTIDTSNTFTATVTLASGLSYSKSVTPSDKEVWLVVDKSSGVLVSRTLESTANAYMNIDDDSYVTVSAKAYKGKTTTAPVLKYKFEQAQSSTAKRNLLNKILEAQEYVVTDYTDDSFNALTTAIAEATEVYNRVDLQTDSIYEAEITKLNNAIKGLVVKACDIETLNALKALYNNNYKKYTDNQKDYDADAYASLYEIFVYVDNVINSNVPLAVRDATGKLTGVTFTDSQMSKSIVEDAQTALTAAMANADANMLDRNPLRDQITLAQGIVDDTAYTAETRGELAIQITIAQSVLDTVTLKQENLDDALNDLKVKYEATLNSRVSTLDTDVLSGHLTEANTILTNAKTEEGKKNYTDATYSALSTAYTDASATLHSAVNQEQIDAADANLTKAINNFTVYKPTTSSDCYETNMIRVWLDMLPVYSDNAAALDAGIRVSVQKDEGTPYMPEIGFDAAWQYYYFDIDKTAYNKATVTFIKDGVTYTSPILDITDADTILCADSLVDEGNKLGMVSKKLVTLYVPNIVDNAECGGFFKPGVTIEKTVDDVVDHINLGLITDSGNYFYCRFVYSEGQKITIHQKVDGTDPTIHSKEFEVPEFGEYISNLTYNGSAWEVSILDVSDIYPKTNIATTSPDAPTVGGTSFNYHPSSDYTVSTLLQNNLMNNGFSIENLATSSTPAAITVEAGKTCIWLDTQGLDVTSPRVHAFNAGSGASATAWDARPTMIKYDTDGRYYWLCISDSYDSVVITLKGDTKYGGDIKLTKDPSTGKPYKYQTFNKSTNVSAANASNSVPVITTTSTTGSLEGTTTEVNMAFVGGKYYQLTNQSYGVALPPAWSNKFGGTWSGSPGSSCQGRTGDTKGSVMYDWYDYKLPIDSGDLYSVQIKGLSGSDGTVRYTESAQNIWGDSWFVLNGNDNSSNLYNNVSLYSFDPADAQLTKDVTLYVKVPPTWKSVELAASGFGNTTTAMTKHTAASALLGYTCYSATISSTTPYLQFTAQVEDSTGAIKTEIYKTTLQGGDYLLFDPTLKLGKGAWQVFVDPVTQLRREIVQSISTYFGKVLPSSYDAMGFPNGVYQKPEGFKGYVVGYLTGNNEVDPTKIPTSWSAARSQYNTLHDARLAYENLFTVMSSARAYLGGHNYPEYLNRGTTATYNIGNLETDYNSAVTDYLTATSLSTIKTWTSVLKTDIAGITVEHQNSAIAVFADVRNRVANGATITMSYSVTPGGSPVTVNVDQVNTENYPIAFIKQSLLPDGTAYGVYFTITDISGTTTTDKQDIKVDEAYVWLDYAVTARWAANATTGYLNINSNEITQQTGSTKYNIKFDDSGSGYMTVYFKDDTVVKMTSGTTYTILAGAYSFEKTASGFVDMYGNTVPFALDGTDYSLNLFTAEAEAYFSKATVKGQFDGGMTGESLGWVDSQQLKITSRASTAHAANITVNSVRTFNVSLGSLTGLYFRYTGSNGITINNKTFKLSAPDIRLALPSGGVKAGSATMSHFYLASGDSIASTIDVTFITDVHIEYTDTLGVEHDFVIHEGRYRIKKNPSITEIGIIADLFDENYWKSNEYVTLLDGTSSGDFSGGSGTLGHPIYE